MSVPRQCHHFPKCLDLCMLRRHNDCSCVYIYNSVITVVYFFLQTSKVKMGD